MTGIKGGGSFEKTLGVQALKPFIDLDLVLERLVEFRLQEVEGTGNHVLLPVHCVRVSIGMGKVAIWGEAFCRNAFIDRSASTGIVNNPARALYAVNV